MTNVFGIPSQKQLSNRHELAAIARASAAPVTRIAQGVRYDAEAQRAERHAEQRAEQVHEGYMLGGHQGALEALNAFNANRD